MDDFKIINGNTFPKIYFPCNFSNSSNVKIPFKEIYPNVKKPTYPLEPEEVKISSFACIIYGIIWSIFIWFVVTIIHWIFTGLFSDITNAYWKTSITLLSVIVGISVMVSDYYKNKKQNAILHEKHIIDLKKHVIQVEKYKVNLENYNRLIEKINSDKFQNEEKIKRNNIELASIKKHIFESLQILDDSQIKKGISEEFFYKYLKKYSDFNVYKSIKHSFYYPDLIIVKNNLVIDLEIDEPYSFDSKEPIHFDNYDKERDDLFLRSGFNIIRFSEDQILNYPNKCLVIIEEIIESYLNLKKYKKSSSFLEIESKVWSYEDAFNMAYNGTRNGIGNKINKLQIEYNL